MRAPPARCTCVKWVWLTHRAKLTVGSTLSKVGSSTYSNPAPRRPLHSSTSTLKLCSPREPPAVVQRMLVVTLTLIIWHATPPICTLCEVPDPRCCPLIVILVPPDTGPKDGTMGLASRVGVCRYTWWENNNCTCLLKWSNHMYVRSYMLFWAYHHLKGTF